MIRARVPRGRVVHWLVGTLRRYAYVMSPTLTLDDIVVVSDNQVSADLSDEVVILGMKEGEYFGVEAVGARIWTLLQTPRRLGDVVATLTDEYAVPAERCTAEVLAFVEDLVDRGLVTCRVEEAP